MVIEKILELEQNNTSEIHLLKEGSFYETYEKSCFLFYRNLFPYQVKCNFVKKVAQSVVSLGFSAKNIDKIRNKALSLGFALNFSDEKHLIVSNVPVATEFDSWKIDQLSKAMAKPADVQNVEQSQNKNRELLQSQVQDGPNSLLPVLAIATDLTQYLLRRSADFAKNFKYTLGVRLQTNVMDLQEMLYLHMQGIEPVLNIKNARELIYRIRAEIRTLHGLKQLSVKQFFFANQKLELLLNSVF